MALEDDDLAKSIQQSVENTITASNSILNNVTNQNEVSAEARDNAAFVAETANNTTTGVGSEMQATDIINNNAGGGGGATTPPNPNLDATALAYQEYLDSIGSQGNFDPDFYNKGNKGAAHRRGKGDNIRVGQFTGKEIGSIPIFAAGGFVMPDLGLDERKQNLAKAEAAKKKAQNEIAKYAHVDVPQQYQKGVTNKSFEILQNYMKLTNNDLSILQNADNPLAIEFQKDRKALADLDLVMTEADRLQKTILSPDKSKTILENSFIPTEVKEAANFIKKGSTDIDYLLTDEGQAELNDKMMMINLYDDRFTRLKTVKNTLDKDTETKFSNPAGILNTLDAETQASIAANIGKIDIKGTDKGAIMKVVHEFVPKEDIYRSVEEAYAGGNIYLDKNLVDYSEEERKNMSDSQIEKIDREYTINKGVLIVEDMLGDKVTANLSIFKKWQPSPSYGSSKKTQDTPFAIQGNKFEGGLKSNFKGLQNIYGTMNALDPNATGYAGKNNTLIRSSVSSFANTMGGTAVQAGDLGGINTDGTMLMSKITVQNNPIKSNEVNINDFRFGDQGLNANDFMAAVAQKPQGGLSPQEVKTVEFITGEPYASQKDLNNYITTGKLNNRLASATNDMNMGTTNHVATAYYGDQPWDNSTRVKIMNEAKQNLLAKNANATADEIAKVQQSAVSNAMSSLHLVDRVYVTAQTDIPVGISPSDWKKIQDVPSYSDIFNDGTSAADIQAKKDAMAKLKQAVGDNVLSALMGSKTKMGGFKSFNDPAYNGVKMFIPFDYNNANSSNQLDERFYKQGNVSLQGGKTFQSAAGSGQYAGETQGTSSTL